MKLNEIREQRAGKIAEMRQITETASNENRDLSGEERKRFDALDGETRALNVRLTDAEKLAEFERLEAKGESVSGGDIAHRSIADYSLSKALTESRSGGLTGLEAEWHQELSKDRSEVRGVMVPTEIILHGEQRALTTTSPGAGPGSNLVATQLGAMTDRRRAALRTEAMGATVLRGLTGNLDLPRLTGSGTAGWVSEHMNADRSDAAFSKTSMGPKTVTAEYEVSRRMLLQANQALEPILRADLGYLLAQSLDSAAIRGGGDNEPVGILADAGVLQIEEIDPGTNFSNLTADLISALETDNVTGTAAFLTNPKVMNRTRKIRDGDGHTYSQAELFHNERVEASTQVPDNIGEDSDKSALIYGEWASLYIGYWSGVDLLMNPYHSDVASKGGAILHAFLDADVVVRHPEGFRYSEVG
jgi:HK97 family phage major capsid protein